MSQLKLTANSGGGTVAIKGPASTTGNAALDLTVPGTASATLDTLKRSGNILQVVQSIKKVASSHSTSDSFVDIGLSATITPTLSTSKLLIQVDVTWSASNNIIFSGKLYDGSTEITDANTTGASSVNAWFAAYSKASTSTIFADQINNLSHSYLYQMSDTNAHTIKVYGNGQSETLYINRRAGSADRHGASIITIMEVAA